MNFFARRREKKETEKLEARFRELSSEKYEQKHLKECRHIWKTMVPKRGQADTLQGELLRQTEKLRYEAQNNGNINWDGNFSHFCDFLTETLCGSTALEESLRFDVKAILRKLKECGEYAESIGKGDTDPEQMDIEKIACTGDNLYDRLGDAVAGFYLAHPDPIPYQHNPDIYR